jgi:putative ABC transport system substrate-binding protein
MRIRRRELLWLMGAMSLPLRARAQKKHRMGILAVGISSSEQIQMANMIFLGMLSRAGLEEGRNLEIEWRYAEGDMARLPALAEELVKLKVDLILASFNPSIAAAKGATRTIPIVMVNALAPVEQGYVASLARPGGNVTGTAWSSPETMGKIFQVIKEAAPKATRLAVLGNQAFPGDQVYRKVGLEAAAKLGMTLEYFDARRPEDVGPALERVAAFKAQALYAAVDTVLIASLREIAEFARKRKLVSMSTASTYVDVGGLLYYGPDLMQLVERTVSYIARILNGARPADLPVELPANYKLIINKRTANAIGYKIPVGMLTRADQVIE